MYEVGTCPLLVEVLWTRGSDLGCFSSDTYKFVYTVPGEWDRSSQGRGLSVFVRLLAP